MLSFFLLFLLLFLNKWAHESCIVKGSKTRSSETVVHFCVKFYYIFNFLFHIRTCYLYNICVRHTRQWGNVPRFVHHACTTATRRKKTQFSSTHILAINHKIIAKEMSDFDFHILASANPRHHVFLLSEKKTKIKKKYSHRTHIFAS